MGQGVVEGPGERSKFGVGREGEGEKAESWSACSRRLSATGQAELHPHALIRIQHYSTNVVLCFKWSPRNGQPPLRGGVRQRSASQAFIRVAGSLEFCASRAYGLQRAERLVSTGPGFVCGSMMALNPAVAT